MRFVIPVLVVLAVQLSGCSRGEEKNVCTRNTAYLEAGSASPLRVPDDLSLPDESDAMRVPDEVSSVGAGALAVECLEYSPAFEAENVLEPDD